MPRDPAAALTPQPQPVTLESLAAEGRMVAYPAAQILELYLALGRMTSLPAGMTLDETNAMRGGLLRVKLESAGPQPVEGPPKP